MSEPRLLGEGMHDPICPKARRTAKEFMTIVKAGLGWAMQMVCGHTEIYICAGKSLVLTQWCGQRFSPGADGAGEGNILKYFFG